MDIEEIKKAKKCMESSIAEIVRGFMVLNEVEVIEIKVIDTNGYASDIEIETEVKL